MDQRRMLDGREKLDEDSLLFSFSLTQKPRTIQGLSPRGERSPLLFMPRKKENHQILMSQNSDFDPLFLWFLMVKVFPHLAYKIVALLWLSSKPNKTRKG